MADAMANTRQAPWGLLLILLFGVVACGAGVAILIDLGARWWGYR